MRIIIGGDVFLGGEAEQHALERPSKIWHSSIKSVFKKADLRIVNLESPLTDYSRKLSKTGPNLKARKETIDCLTELNIDLVTLANNHILDYGKKGLEDTMSTCLDNNIDYVGADINLELAKKTYYKTIGDKRIAVVNFAENEWASATEDGAGAHPMDLIDNINQIKQASQNSDHVLVIVHGGHEHYHYPSPRILKQYRFYAENGASAVVAHHPHCVSGYEVHRNVPIFYSIGNLFFSDNTDFEGWYEGILVSLTFGGSINWEIIPYRQCSNNSFLVEALTPQESDEFIKTKIHSLNKVIANSDELRSKWDDFVMSQLSNRSLLLAGKTNIFYLILNKLGLSSLFLKKSYLRLLLNLVRCEAHRDLSIDILNTQLKDT
ncbi:MAG: CapA family protein [Bacteroidota bacterium]